MISASEFVAELLPLQDAFNKRVAQDWTTRGFAWHRAIWMECAELVEGTQSWKWWKAAGQPSIEQIRLEVIDILHFQLSWSIEMSALHSGVSGASSANEFGERVLVDTFAKVDGMKLDGEPQMEDVILAAEKLVAAAVDGDFVGSSFRLAELAASVGLDIQTMRTMYLGKNALNTFRNMNGYKEGTYTKIWDGREDNVHLEEMMAADPSAGFDALIEKLCASYQTHANSDVAFGSLK